LEYRLFHAAKGRAKRNGIPFNLNLDDIVIGETCPLLGIKLYSGKNTIQPNSPTLDKAVPELGYVKGNVWVISQKANQMKSDLSLSQLEGFVRILRDKIVRE